MTAFTAKRMDAARAESLLAAEGEELSAVLAAASDLRDEGLRRAGRPGVMTYSRKVFLPLTTLCRDRCHYCVFVDTPNQLARTHKPLYMAPEQVLAIARRGAELGCKEALLTLGDRPEDRWPAARAWLDEHGYTSTLDYVGAMARLVREETGLLPHLNPGVMTLTELKTLRSTAPSMGMMLETTSRRLFEEPGQAHYGSPDKDPALRRRVLDDAGIAQVPFTTGILVGIGETLSDRVESLLAIRDAHERHGHIQEVIVQNFRAKPRTAMRAAPDAGLREYVAAIAVARLLLGPDMRIQVPPNLSDPDELALLVAAGADDWGGVSPLTADHVNPERPWPQIDELAQRTADLGFRLRERLTAHPEYIRDAERWLHPEVAPATRALADPVSGLARLDAPVRAADRGAGTGGVRRTGTLIERAAQDPGSIDDAEWAALLTVSGTALDHLTETADQLRRFTIGETVSIVVNRNISSAAFRARTRGEPDTYDVHDLTNIVRDATALGVSEVCVQGIVDPGEAPDAALTIARTITAADPRVHLHAFRPSDIDDLARRRGLDLRGTFEAMRAAGVSTVPGTGVKVLNERVRRAVAPADLDTQRWVEIVTAAHRFGFRSTSVLFYGHVETAAERIAHLRYLRTIQESTGGFTEFVPIPLPGPGVPLVPGRAPIDEHRAMFAVARLMLSGAITHVQVPWTRLDEASVVAALRSGADDLGGTLLDGRILPRVGAEHGHEMTLDHASRIAGRLARTLRVRSTDYTETVRLSSAPR